MSIEPYRVLTFGQSQLRPGDFIPPRVKIIQAQSQEVADGRASPGELWNTLTSENFGTQLEFLPLAIFMNRLLFARPERIDTINELLSDAGLPGLDPSANGLVCRSTDMLRGSGTPGIECASCPLSVWRGSEPPLCGEVWNLAAMTELGDLVILSFSRSSAKVGKRVASMLRLSRGAPWSQYWQISTRQEKGRRGIYFVPEVQKISKRPNPDIVTWAASWAQQLGAMGPIDMTPVDEDEAEAEIEPADEPF